MRTRRCFLICVLTSLLVGCGAEPAPPRVIIGHLDHAQAVLAYEPPDGEKLTLVLREVRSDAPPRRVQDQGRRVGRWHIRGLRANTEYVYELEDASGRTRAVGTFRTGPAPDARTDVRLALGSCASIEETDIWRQIRDEVPDAVVLLGDTPYVDTTEPDRMFALHRGFLRISSLARLATETPLWSTWDDHDYGVDNGDGRFAAKRAARDAFMAWRPQARYGTNGEGIFTSVRYGPVEVILLDLRWFAGLEAMPGDSGERSLLGAVQRQWLQDTLRASDAPFKLICGGMVWHDKQSRSQDDWASYPAERDALFDFLGREGIAGCVLVGGDVHACQHAVFEGTGAGYPLHQLVISPLHGRAWRGGDRQHPARRWGRVEPRVYLVVDVDSTTRTPTLTATWKSKRGTARHKVQISQTALVKR